MSMRDDGRREIAALLLEGLPVREVALRLYFTRDYVQQVRRSLQRRGALPLARGPEVYEPWTPPDPEADERRRALERGRALVAAKLARGEWVLPRTERDGQREVA